MATTFNLGVAQGIIRITYDPKGVAAAEAGQAKLGKTSATTAASMEKASKRIATGGLIIAAGLGLAAKEASDFQAKMTLLVTAGGESQAALSGVAKGIENIAIETGTSLSQAADGMYIVEKAGIRGANGLNVLRAAAEGAKAEGVDLQVMTQGLTSIMQSYATTMKDPIAATNALVVAAGMAKTTMTNFVNALPNVLPLASAVGISFQDVAGAIATMTQHGTSAAEATQELNNTIRGLVAPNQVAQKAMQQLGINVVDLEKNVGKRGLAGSINLVVDAIGKHLGPAGTVVVDAFKKSQSAGQDLQIMLSKMPPDLKSISQGFLDGTVSAKDYRMGFKDMGAQGAAMGMQFMSLAQTASGFNDLLKSGQPAAQSFTMYLKQMMGGATGMNTALQLTGASSAYFNKAVKAIGEAAGKSGKDIDTWALTQKNAATQMGRLKASVQVLGVEIGQVILPILVKIANGVTNVIKGFNGLSDTWQKVIAYGALVLASFLLLSSALIKMYTMVIKLREIWLVIKALSIWTKIAAAAQWLWNGALAAFAALEEVTGIGLIVAAIVLLVAAIVLIIKYHKQIWTFVKMVWGDIWSFMKVIGAWFAGPFVNFFVAVWHGIMVAFNAVKAVVMAVVNFVIGYVMFWYNTIKGIVMFFAPLFKAVFGLIRAIIELELKLIWLFISAIILAIKFVFLTNLHAIEAVWTAVWHAMSVAAHAIWGAIGPYVMGTLRALASFFRAVWGGIRSVAISIWNAIYSYIRGKVNAIIAVAKTIGRIVAIVVGFFAKIQSGVNTQIGKLLGLVGTIAGKVLHAIGNLGSVLYNAGKDIIQGLINGVSSKINALTDKLHSITKLIPHIKGPEVVDKKLLTPNGRMIMEGLVAGIDSMVPVLHKQLAGLTKTIPVNVLATATTHSGGVVHGGGAPIRSTIPPNQTNKSAASSGHHFGPYHMMLDKGVVASFVIDTVTGNPTIISTTTQKGNRKRAWAGGRKPTS